MKKSLAFAMAVIVALSLSSCTSKIVKGSIVSQSDSGMAVLDIMPQKLFEFAAIGDTVRVTAGSFQAEMPLVDEMIEEADKLQLFYDAGDHCLKICIFDQDFCEKYSIPTNTSVHIEKG